MRTKASIVGRYETSGMVDSNTNATIKVVAGSDNTTNAKISSVTWYRMYAQQKKYAENKGLTNVVGSTMIQGAAYDQVMKFVNDTTKYNVKSTGYALHNRSTQWQTAGLNYTDRTQYKDVAKNIYDLEGNVSAWTTEAYDTNLRVFTGGSFSYSISASCRNTGSPSYSDLIIGSVPQLYVK